MIDSSFWRDLELRFRKLQSDLRHDLRANWISTAWNTGEQWFVNGGPEHSRSLFQSLAERGAILLGRPRGSTALFYWLDLLKQDSPYFRMDGHGTSWENEKTSEYETGRIDQLCEASADYCVKLENGALVNTVSHPTLRRPVSKDLPGRAFSEEVELGEGGVKFVRRGAYTLAEPCDAVNGRSPFGAVDNGTVSAVRISYGVLSAELPKVYALVKAKRGAINGKELRKQFRSSPLSKVTDAKDWEGWAADFSPLNRDRGRPKGAALTFLERKMPLNRNTLKSYLSRAKKPPRG